MLAPLRKPARADSVSAIRKLRPRYIAERRRAAAVRIHAQRSARVSKGSRPHRRAAYLREPGYVYRYIHDDRLDSTRRISLFNSNIYVYIRLASLEAIVRDKVRAGSVLLRVQIPPCQVYATPELFIFLPSLDN